MTDELLTIKVVAAFPKLNEKTAYRLTASKELPGFKVGGSWHFRKSELLKWMGSQHPNAYREGSDEEA